MSAEIIQFVPRPNPNRPTFEQLEQQAIEIMAIALSGDPVPLGQGPTIYIDTSPSEMNLDEPA